MLILKYFKIKLFLNFEVDKRNLHNKHFEVLKIEKNVDYAVVLFLSTSKLRKSPILKYFKINILSTSQLRKMLIWKLSTSNRGFWSTSKIIKKFDFEVLQNQGLQLMFKPRILGQHWFQCLRRRADWSRSHVVTLSSSSLAAWTHFHSCHWTLYFMCPSSYCQPMAS